jgi:hypothetical protein
MSSLKLERRHVIDTVRRHSPSKNYFDNAPIEGPWQSP